MNFRPQGQRTDWAEPEAKAFPWTDVVVGCIAIVLLVASAIIILTHPGLV